MRELLKNHLKFLAKAIAHKNHTSVILIYGWDWAEGLREGLYYILEDKINVRRNTSWIDWDLGYPLALMGYTYHSSQSKLQLLISIIKAWVRLVFPHRYNNTVILTAHAKSEETLEYWLSIVEPQVTIVLPRRNNPFRKDLIGALDEYDYDYVAIDLKSPEFAAISDLPFPTVVQSTLVIMLNMLVPKIEEEYELRFKEVDIEAAVLKLDLENMMLRRIKQNLHN